MIQELHAAAVVAFVDCHGDSFDKETLERRGAEASGALTVGQEGRDEVGKGKSLRTPKAKCVNSKGKERDTRISQVSSVVLVFVDFRLFDHITLSQGCATPQRSRSQDVWDHNIQTNAHAIGDNK
jgi:hypothetical protein